MSDYKERVEERRNWELREISRAIYGAAVCLMIVDIAIAVLVVYVFAGDK